MPFVPKDSKEPVGVEPDAGEHARGAALGERSGRISGVMPSEAAWGVGDGDDVRGWRAIVSAESWRDRLDLLVACAVIGWADLAFADVVDPDEEVVRSRLARRPVAHASRPDSEGDLSNAPLDGADLASVLASAGEPARWEGWERPCASTEPLRRRAARAFGWPDHAAETEGERPVVVVPPGWPSSVEGEWLSLPLLGRDRSLGCLTLWSREGNRTEHDLGRACRLTHFGALALDEALRRGQAERASGNAELAAAVFDERLRELAHELRTPLSSALLWLTVLRSGSASTTPPIDAVEQCIRQQQKIIDAALDPAKPRTARRKAT